MRFYDTPTRLQILRELLARGEARSQASSRRPPMLLRLRRLLGWTAALASLPMLLPHVAAQSVPAARIITVAGNGTAGYVAAQDGGLAIRAQLDEPYGAAIDRTGNIYIAERANHRIRRVDATTNVITTVAGNGQPGFRSSDEGGPATAAELNEPRAVAVDILGNLYIADTGNHRIRKVDASGTIRTIAGTGVPGYRAADEAGLAIAAQLDSPRAVALDAPGNLYIADYNNQRIRKILVATGTIQTVAGTGTPGYLATQGGGPATEAEINNPYGIAFDTLGNLYIADTGNHRIRRVEVHTGLITTVAGNGSPGYRAADEGKLATRVTLNTPTGIAVDVAGNLYIADMDENCIRRVDAATGTISTIAGAGVPGYIAAQDGEAAALARLNRPRAVALDLQGNLYIADSANNRIRKVETGRSSVYIAIK